MDEKKFIRCKITPRAQRISTNICKTTNDYLSYGLTSTQTRIQQHHCRYIITRHSPLTSHLSPDQFNLIFSQLFPSQVPNSLKFVDIRNEITYTLSLLKQLSPNKTGPLPPITRSSVGIITDGQDSLTTLASKISGWKTWDPKTATNSSAALQNLYETINLGEQEELTYELKR